jgi:hypothetical protein
MKYSIVHIPPTSITVALGERSFDSSPTAPSRRVSLHHHFVWTRRLTLTHTRITISKNRGLMDCRGEIKDPSLCKPPSTTIAVLYTSSENRVEKLHNKVYLLYSNSSRCVSCSTVTQQKYHTIESQCYAPFIIIRLVQYESDVTRPLRPRPIIL